MATKSGPGVDKRKLKSPGKNSKKGKKNQGAGPGEGSISKIDGRTVRMRCREEITEKGREYVIHLQAENDLSGDLKIVAQGEDGSEALNIISALTVDNSPMIVDGDTIKGVELSAGKAHPIRIKLKSDRRYVLGVK
jgi:hypothetical protein